MQGKVGCYGQVWLALLVTLLIFPHFARAFDTVRLQAAFRRMGGSPQVFLDWQPLLKENREFAIADKLQMVNHFFNLNIEFATDHEVWDQDDNCHHLNMMVG